MHISWEQGHFLHNITCREFNLDTMLLSDLLSRVWFPQLSWYVFFFFSFIQAHSRIFTLHLIVMTPLFLSFISWLPEILKTAFLELWQLSPTVRHFPLWPVLKLYRHIHCLVMMPHWRPWSLAWIFSIAFMNSHWASLDLVHHFFS